MTIPPSIFTTIFSWLKAPLSGWRQRRLNRQRLLDRLKRDDEYQLYQSPHGAVVLQSKANPKIYICQRCCEDGKHYLLQPVDRSTDASHRCPSCKVGYQVDAPYKMPPLPPMRGGPNSWMGN